MRKLMANNQDQTKLEFSAHPQINGAITQRSLNRMWRHILVDDSDTKKMPGVAECSNPL